VAGRGELHLSVLIETMRREGFELGVSRPEVIRREIDGVMQEPFEELVIDCEDAHQGSRDGRAGAAPRRAQEHGARRQGARAPGVHVPARGLIGFPLPVPHADQRQRYHDPYLRSLRTGQGGGDTSPQQRRAGVDGERQDPRLRAFNLQDRGRLFVDPNIEVYEGQIVGLHSRGNDLPVNPTKAKQLTNIRAAGTDEALVLTPPVKHTLEQALEFIDDDELVEVTPREHPPAQEAAQGARAQARLAGRVGGLMQALLQRVREAAVRIDGEVTGAIGPGLVVFLGLQPDDDRSTGEKLLERVLAYRVFADDEGRMNRSLRDTRGGLLLISQFTLAADTTRGLRPGFSTAMAPAEAEPLFAQLYDHACNAHDSVAGGRFGADMQVSLVNDGPVTFLLRSR
jgi:D-tyrosyl-tRNA(Tyr) deacylase